MPRLHRIRLAREKCPRLGGEFGIFRERDLLRARARAALDLEQQAGPRPVLVVAVVAAQEEGALKRVDGAVHRPDAGEGAVVIPLPLSRAAVLHELRRLVVARQQDVGERLVVPHQHVVAGLELLDEVGLQQQRFRLRRRGDELHRGGFADHAGDAVGVGLPSRIGAHAGLQALGLAHVEHIAPGVEHAVDAGRLRQRGPEMPDDLGSAPDRVGLASRSNSTSDPLSTATISSSSSSSRMSGERRWWCCDS